MTHCDDDDFQATLMTAGCKPKDIAKFEKSSSDIVGDCSSNTLECSNPNDNDINADRYQSKCLNRPGISHDDNNLNMHSRDDDWVGGEFNDRKSQQLYFMVKDRGLEIQSMKIYILILKSKFYGAKPKIMINKLKEITNTFK